MNQNLYFTGVKPQSLLIRRVQGLIVCLAATSHIFCDMVQTPTLYAAPSNWISKKIKYLTHFESFGIAFMKTHEGGRNMNAKETNMGKIIEAFFEHVCLSVCGCTVYMHIMVGAWPQWLAQSCSIPPYGIQSNPHFGSNTRLHRARKYLKTFV